MIHSMEFQKSVISEMLLQISQPRQHTTSKSIQFTPRHYMAAENLMISEQSIEICGHPN